MVALGLIKINAIGALSGFAYAFKSRKGANMPRLSAPTRVIFVISLIVAVAAVIAFFFMAAPLNSQTAFWTAIVAYVVLALGCVMTGV